MTIEKAVEILKQMDEFAHVCQGEDFEAIRLAVQMLETGEVYMTGKDYNLYMEGYKQGKKDFERPKGHWIEHTDYVGDTYYDCSNCKEPWTTIEGTPWQNMMNFCPNCGAKMQEGEKK